MYRNLKKFAGYHKPDSSGIALIMALWVLMVLTVMVAEVANLSRIDSRIVLNLKHQNQAHCLAVSGIDRAIHLLLIDKTDDIDSPEDKWASELTEEMDNGGWQVETIDEQRKLNINQSNSYILTELLKQCNIDQPEEIANKIIDYRDVNELSQLGAGEEETKNLLFDSIGELEQITTGEPFLKLKGHLSAVGRINLNMADLEAISTLLYERGVPEHDEMVKRIFDFRKYEGKIIPFTPADTQEKLTGAIGEESYQLIKDCITTEPAINVNTASKEVLAGFFLGVLGAGTGYLADKIIQEREGGKPFTSTADLYQRVEELSLIIQRDIQGYIPIKECLGVKSRYFTITSTGWIKHSPIRRQIRAVVERYRDSESKWQVKILSWVVS